MRSCSSVYERSSSSISSRSSLATRQGSASRRARRCRARRATAGGTCPGTVPGHVPSAGAQQFCADFSTRPGLRGCSAYRGRVPRSAPIDLPGVRRLARDHARRRAAKGLPRPRRRPAVPRPALAGRRPVPAGRLRPLPDAEPLPLRRRVPARAALTRAAPGERRSTPRHSTRSTAGAGTSGATASRSGRCGTRSISRRRARYVLREPGPRRALLERRRLAVELEPLRRARRRA